MKLMVKKLAIVAMLVSAFGLTACSTNQVVDNTVGVAAGATRLAVKGTVGAGKLAYQGGSKVAAAFE